MNTVEQVIQHLKKGELTEALKHINRIKSSESAEDILLLAEEMLQLGFVEEAKDLFEHLLELYPDEGELIVSLAEILIDMDQEDEAMLMLEKVSADDEVYPSALLLESWTFINYRGWMRSVNENYCRQRKYFPMRSSLILR